MAIYRLVWRYAKGGDIRSTHIECSTDREALEIAERQMRGDDEISIEIWDEFRPVGQVRRHDQLDKG
jgi:hypothetical protein